VHCNNADIAAHMKYRDSFTDRSSRQKFVGLHDWAVISTSAPAKPGIMPSSSPRIIIMLLNSCSYTQPLV